MTHGASGVAPPSPFLSIQTSQLPDTSSGGIQSPVLANQRQHESPSTSNEKGDEPAVYVSGHVPRLHLSGSPVTTGPSTTTDEALEEVSSPPPAYGNGHGGGFPRT